MRPGLNERQHQIMDRIQNEGEVKVSDLKDYFQVTEMTVRRDMEKLEQLGLIRRTFGGAIPVTPDISLKERDTVQTQEKMKIGRLAAGLVLPGQAIFIDAGTTTLQVARYLPSGSGITVVTNALNVAAELMEKHIHTIVVGGLLLEQTMSLVGPLAVEALQKMAFDQVFLGATGFTLQHGFSNSNVFEAELKKKAIQQATTVNMVLDDSKFGAKLLISFAELTNVSRIISNISPEASFMEAAAEANVEIVV
ncbi:DeoR/GlpR family DNA-binding transcription regulator [Paenibacillus eucommiae]|uniref:DeoR family transcriptional regulator of aga operon/DeoR family fructose operon transcriptional repressor n=1 Tax=Paenibacillus eucommiae TaxID=1355755 RepID=A0ABS4J0J8_9BACL|nr:DeoR/GlpR family DNA-binding transcription regulator [Paenibacillus eucommiae]MBP1993350.1 DeoR family transcriptional regulator of aga operon/DeoR family fructose operon transcriptional repressor [Paenibacillus eucommiae]